MKVLTQSRSSFDEIEMSTGRGTFEGSPISPASAACHSPASSRYTTQSFEVSAVDVNA